MNPDPVTPGTVVQIPNEAALGKAGLKRCASDSDPGADTPQGLAERGQRAQHSRSECEPIGTLVRGDKVNRGPGTPHTALGFSLRKLKVGQVASGIWLHIPPPKKELKYVQ